MKPSAYRATTLDGFRRSGGLPTFPQRAGHDPRIVNGARPNYVAIRDTAARLVAAGHLNDVLAASFAHLFVERVSRLFDTPALTCNLAGAKPAYRHRRRSFSISIFGFGGDPLADWQAKFVVFFPLAGELSDPLAVDQRGSARLRKLAAGHTALIVATGKPIDIRTAALGVEWVQLDGRRGRCAASRGGRCARA